MVKGISLHIGLNSVDVNHYDGWDGTLLACEADAADMEAIAAKEGFSHRTCLLTQDATFNRVVKELEEAAAVAESGDLVLLTYSGHGGQVPDLNRDENDLADETWCLFDRQLIDDHLYELLAAFKSGVRIIVLSDSCHSGTVVRAARRGTALRVAGDAKPRAMPPDVAYRVYRKNKALYDSTAITEPYENVKGAVRASVILISGCQDNQLSADGAFNGLFTGTLLRVWQTGQFGGSYQDLHREILRRMPAEQTPNYFTVGEPNPAFEGQRAFAVNPA
jgi:hypothetical protein